MSSDTEWCLAELVQLVGVGAKGCQAVELVCVPVRAAIIAFSVGLCICANRHYCIQQVFVSVRTYSHHCIQLVGVSKRTVIIAFS